MANHHAIAHSRHLYHVPFCNVVYGNAHAPHNPVLTGAHSRHVHHDDVKHKAQRYWHHGILAKRTNYLCIAAFGDARPRLPDIRSVTTHPSQPDTQQVQYFKLNVV